MTTKRKPGYRNAPERPLAPQTPAGELLAPSAEDRAALDRLRARERASVYGIAVLAAMLIRSAGPLLTDPLYYAGAVLVGVILILYAIYRRLNPRGFGHLIIRLSPTGEVAAGLRLGVALIVRPHAALALDPLLVRLVARQGDAADAKVVYETVHRLAERQQIGADEAARIETSIQIPEDVPPTSSTPRVRWRVEVSVGEPRRMLGSAAVRVRASTRRRRRTDAQPE